MEVYALVDEHAERLRGAVQEGKQPLVGEVHGTCVFTALLR
jgi:hypothetical protein